MINSSRFPNFITRSETKLRLEPRDAGGLLAEVQKHLPVYCYAPDRDITFVTTIYFDTEDLRFFNRASRFRHDNLKIRLKEYYYQLPAGFEVSPYCWVEVKRRLGESTSKHRFKVLKDMVGRLFAGEDCFEDIITVNASLDPGVVRCVYDDFLTLVRKNPVRPYSVTNYRRRTFQNGDDESLRVTFDDMIAYFRAPPSLYNGVRALVRGVLGGVCGEQTHTVVEIKATVELPGWLQKILDRHPQSSFSKFLTSTQSLLRVPKDILSDTNALPGMRGGGAPAHRAARVADGAWDDGARPAHDGAADGGQPPR